MADWIKHRTQEQEGVKAKMHRFQPQYMYVKLLLLSSEK